MAARELFAFQPFEDQLTNGWTNGAGSALSGWATASGGLNGSSFRMDGTFTGTNNNDLYASLNMGSGLSSGVVTVAFTIKTHGETTTRGIAVGVGAGRTASNRNVYIRAGSNGNLEYRTTTGWTTLIAYVANTEYDFRFEIDVDAATVDIYVDDVLKADGVVYPDASPGDPRYVFFNRFSGDSPTGTAQFDDVTAKGPVASVTTGTQGTKVGTAPNYGSSEGITGKPFKTLFNIGSAKHMVSWDGETGWYFYEWDSTDSIWVSKEGRVDIDPDSRYDVYYDGTAAWLFKVEATTNELSKWTLSAGKWTRALHNNTTVDGAHAPTSTMAHNAGILVDTNSRVWIFWERDVGANAKIEYSVYKQSDLTRETGETGVRELTTTNTLDQDDLFMSVVFNDGTASIGVFLSDQDNSLMEFAHHHDSDAVATWQTLEAVVSGGANEADDHVDIVFSDNNNELYAIWKTAKTANGDAIIMFNKRDSGGSWGTAGSVWDIAGGVFLTRPRIAFDKTNDIIHAYATTSNSGGDIVTKTSPRDTISWSSESTVLNATALLNNVMTPRFEVTSVSGLMVVCGTHGDGEYLYYNLLPIAATVQISIELGTRAGMTPEIVVTRRLVSELQARAGLELVATVTAGGVTQQIQSELGTKAGIESVPLVTRRVVGELGTKASLEPLPSVTRRLQTRLEARAGLEASLAATRQISAELGTKASMEPLPSLTRRLAAALESRATLTPQVVVTHRLASELETRASLTPEVVVTRRAVAELVAIAGLEANVTVTPPGGVTQQIEAELGTKAGIEVTPTRTRFIAAELGTRASMESLATRVKLISTELGARASMTAAPTRTARLAAVLEARASLEVLATRTARVAVELSAVAGMEAIAARTARLSIELMVRANLEADASGVPPPFPDAQLLPLAIHHKLLPLAQHQQQLPGAEYHDLLPRGTVK